MSMAFVLGISAELTQQIREHGAEAYPHECCGALLGKDGAIGSDLDASEQEGSVSRRVCSLFPLVNRRDDSPRNRFMITAEDVRAADVEAQEQGLDIIGWYHSHPDHPARPSQYDCDHAWPWYSYIIVGVNQGKPEEMTSWRLHDDRQEFSQEGIEIEQHAAI